MPIPEYPITREEFYLAGLVGQSVETPEPITREELYLAKANGESVNVPEPITRLEKYLADIAGEDVETPNPVTRKEFFLAKISGDDVDVPEPTTREEMYLSELGSGSSAKTKTVTGKILHITDALDSPVKDFAISIAPIQSGSGTPSAENVRPISGHDSVNVTRTGKNLLDPSLLKDQSVWNTFKITVNPDTWYICSTNKPKNSLYLHFKNVDIAGGSPSTLVYDGHSVIIKSNGNGEVWISQRRASGSESFADYQIMVKKGYTATDYEPYTGTTLPIIFPSSAGTVYGGTLDVPNGTLTVTHGQISSYNGETLPGAWISDRDVYTAGTTPTTGAQVVYELAEPVVYQLTPEQVETLLGENNIWADCGTVNVTYRADATLAYNKLADQIAALITAAANG